MSNSDFVIEEELRKLWQAIDQSPATVMITDENGNIEYVNPKFTQLTGYTSEEVRGKNPRFLKPDNIPSERYRKLWETISSGGEWHGEFCNKKKNGELYWEYASISPVKNSKGVITSYIAVKEDITERKKLEDKLRMLSHAIDQSPGTVMITDINGNIEYVNPKFTQLTGYEPEEVVGKNPRFLKPDHIPSETYRKLWETITSGGEWRGEMCNKKKNGDIYWEFASVSPVKNSKGVITHFIGVKEDITERKKAEEERNKHIQELEDLMSFSSLTNAAMHDEEIFTHLATALRKHFEPDVTAVVMIDRERNILYVPLSYPVLSVNGLINNEIIFDPSLCTVLKTGQMHVVNDISKESICKCIHYRIERGGYICIPLIAGGKIFGMVLMLKREMNCWKDEKIRRLMSNYVGIAALGIHRLELLDIAKHINVTDELTGVYNHRFFNEILYKQLSLTKRRNENLCLLVLNVDNFKKLCNTYSSSVGDRVLQHTARILGDWLRDAGIIARYGNEAFAIIIPAMFKTRALVRADDLRRIIESADFDVVGTGQALNVTVSIGVATLPEQATDQETLIKCANKALSRAVEEGGNRIASL